MPTRPRPSPMRGPAPSEVLAKARDAGRAGGRDAAWPRSARAPSGRPGRSCWPPSRARTRMLGRPCAPRSAGCGTTRTTRLLVDALRDRARRELGPGATTAELPGGGIEARAGGRRVEYSLDGLADDLLERVGGGPGGALGAMTGTDQVAAGATGRVARVSGPLVEVEGLADVAMSELVELGALRLPGEVVSITDGIATVQAYEYTGGLAPGDATDRAGRAAVGLVGPGPARRDVRRSAAPAAGRRHVAGRRRSDPCWIRAPGRSSPRSHPATSWPPATRSARSAPARPSRCACSCRPGSGEPSSASRQPASTPGTRRWPSWAARHWG